MSKAEPLTMYQRERNYLVQEMARGGVFRHLTPRQWRRMLKKNGHEVARAVRDNGEWSS